MMVRRLFAIAALLSLASCIPSSMREDHVDELYPPDAYRDDIVEGYGAPMHSHLAFEPGTDRFAAGVIHRLEAETGVSVHSWDFYLTLRGGLGSSLGAFGLYGDYLFYTKEGVLIQARRRFLD